MFITRNRRTLFRNGAAALAASAALVLGGCGTAGPEQGTDVGDIQNDQAGGVADGGGNGGNGGAFIDFGDAQSFVGQTVTVSAQVNEIIGPNAFTMADESGEQLLVVSATSVQNLAVDTPVQVTGTVKKAFNLPTAEQFAGADFNDAAFSQFGGEPYIQASNIDTTVTTNQNGS
jgi:hypothetical protein